MNVRMIETGVANVASVRAALERLGAPVLRAEGAADVESADALILPGVGAFGTGMCALRGNGLTDALAARIRAGRPTLAICLGMQLLARTSAESPDPRGLDERGLGVLPVDVVRLQSERLPHFGWSETRADPGCRFLRDGAPYFAHSFCIEDAAALRAQGFRLALATEGQGFVAAIERDGLLACQFHPELSGPHGAALLERWLDAAAHAARAPRPLEVTRW